MNIIKFDRIVEDNTNKLCSFQVHALVEITLLKYMHNLIYGIM